MAQVVTGMSPRKDAQSGWLIFSFNANLAFGQMVTK